MLGNYLDEVRKKAPLIHNITNYVTINDVANMVLACGASPIMSDEPTDIEEITSICQGLNINMGMLNSRKIESMQKAGKKSNELHHKVLLDPVGAGSSTFRTEAALNLIRDIQFDVIRGNISEIKTLAAGHGTTSGVDADEADTLTEQNLEKMIPFIKDFSRRTGSVIAVTGGIDLVSDAKRCFVIRNGRPEMGRIASALADRVIITGDNSRTENPRAIICDILRGIEDRTSCRVIERRRDAIRYAISTAGPGDVILLAGKGHEDYETDKTGKHRFVEREEITDALRLEREGKDDNSV